MYSDRSEELGSADVDPFSGMTWAARRLKGVGGPKGMVMTIEVYGPCSADEDTSWNDWARRHSGTSMGKGDSRVRTGEYGRRIELVASSLLAKGGKKDGGGGGSEVVRTRHLVRRTSIHHGRS